jgi:hypothetical protein
MASRSTSATNISVPQNHVGLVLLHDGDSFFYLQIPSPSILSLCLKPRKYLAFLGWCILGVEGVLSLVSDGEELDLGGDLDDQEIYYYVTKGIFPLLASCCETLTLSKMVPCRLLTLRSSE